MKRVEQWRGWRSGEGRGVERVEEWRGWRGWRSGEGGGVKRVEQYSGSPQEPSDFTKSSRLSEDCVTENSMTL